MADKKRSSRLWDFLVILAIVYLAVEFGMRWFFPQTPQDSNAAAVVLSMQDATLTEGNAPIVIVKNNTDAPLGPICAPLPFDLSIADQSGGWTLLVSGTEGEPCFTISPKSSQKFPLHEWSEHFQQTGTFRLHLQNVSASGTVLAAEAPGDRPFTTDFTIGNPGFFTKTFRAFISKPLLNGLIFIASIVPGHNLGLSIIILTLIVKLLLFIPTQHALEGQKKMQLLQPKFEAVRKQYKDDPKKMQEETMKIWKEHKINPLQSLLPLLVQFPVLIGLFYVIRNGADLELSHYLVYPVYQDLSWTFDSNFLGLDLTQPYVWIFPPMLVVLQFLQIKLSLVIADKKKAKQIAETTTAKADTPQEMQQKIMLYALPLLIGYFALTYPSALSLYWGVSTLFAIGQQMLVNREHIRP